MATRIPAPTGHFCLTPNGTRLHYLIWDGDGPLLLLLHGLGGRATGWASVAEALAPSFRVIAPDLRGHGLSDQPDGPYTTDAYLEDIIALIEHLGATSLQIVGHSLGGLLALHLAARLPTVVKRIVVEDADPGAIPGAAKSRAERMAIYPVPFPSREDGIAFIRERRGESSARWYGLSLVEQPAGGWGWCFSLKAVLATEEQVIERDHWHIIPQVGGPVLLIHGAKSPWITPTMAQALADRLADCRVVAIPDAGHWVHGEQPALYLVALRSFLASS